MSALVAGCHGVMDALCLPSTLFVSITARLLDGNSVVAGCHGASQDRAQARRPVPGGDVRRRDPTGAAHQLRTRPDGEGGRGVGVRVAPGSGAETKTTWDAF